MKKIFIILKYCFLIFAITIAILFLKKTIKNSNLRTVTFNSETIEFDYNIIEKEIPQQIQLDLKNIKPDSEPQKKSSIVEDTDTSLKAPKIIKENKMDTAFFTKPKIDERFKDMVLIPGGKFFIKSLNKTIKIDTFYIDKFEVSVKQIKKFFKINNNKINDALPISNISFENAAKYAKAIKKDLPTAFEWEYAASNLGKTLYPWGNSFNKKKYEQYTISKNNSNFMPVKINSKYKDITQKGIYFLAGNVAEWTCTKVSEIEPDFPNSKKMVICKGISFLDEIKNLKISNYYFSTGSPEAGIGFRCVIRLK